MKLALIAAVARNGVIGRGNALLWRLPEDLRHFRRTTLGCPVIMGRRTWDSLPPAFRPLPGRRNLVVTRDAGWRAEGAEAAPALDAALARVADAPRAFVTGGAELYALALPRADELLLTEIERDFDGDVRFPDWDRAAFVETARERHHAGPPNDFDYAFVTYARKR
ncbi:MAG TPA: dihydrofolate reductase [Burkholderiaceae bacterium]